MADNDLKVIVKAKDLAVHSFKLTSNCNRYPKYRHSLVDRIQIKSLDIYETLLEANRINNVSHKRERCEMITRAITICDEMLFYIELSMMLQLLTDKSAEYWSQMVRDVEQSCKEWKRQERKQLLQWMVENVDIWTAPKPKSRRELICERICERQEMN